MRSFVIFLQAALFLGCATAQFGGLGGPAVLPQASVTRFVPVAVSLRDITFEMDVAVTNPYPVGLPLKGIGVSYEVETVQVFSAQTTENFDIPARGSRTSTFRLVLPFEGLIQTVRNYMDKDYLATTARIRIVLPLPRLPGLPPEAAFDSTMNTRIPAVKPRIQVTGFRVEPPTQADVAEALRKAGQNADPRQALTMFSNILSGRPAAPVVNPQDLDLPFRVRFTVEIENEAKAVLGFPSLDFSLSVDGAPLVSGRSESVNVAGNRTRIEVVNTFSSRNLVQSVRSAFERGTGTFQISGNAQLQLPREVRSDPLPLSFSETGSFRLR